MDCELDEAECGVEGEVGAVEEEEEEEEEDEEEELEPFAVVDEEGNCEDD